MPQTLRLPVQNASPKDQRRNQLDRKTSDEHEGQEQDESARRTPSMPRRRGRVIESRWRRWIDWRVHAQIFSRLTWIRQARISVVSVLQPLDRASPKLAQTFS